MKKIVLTLAALAVMAISSVCNAAAISGKTLDAEQAVVEKFLAATTYKQVEPLMAADMAKDWDEKIYANFQSFMNTNAGKLTNHQLRAAEFFDDADVLTYQASFEKMPQARYVFVFKNVNGKPMLLNINPMFPAPQNQEAPAQQAPAEE